MYSQLSARKFVVEMAKVCISFVYVHWYTTFLVVNAKSSAQPNFLDAVADISAMYNLNRIGESTDSYSLLNSFGYDY